MRTPFQPIWAATIVFTAALTATAMPTPVAAGLRTDTPPRYTLYDAGTFGGFRAYINAPNPVLNSSGALVGSTDTTIADPNPSNCYHSGCLVAYGFVYNKGHRIELKALPGANSSDPFSIDDKGVVTGLSQNGKIDPRTGQPEQVAVVWRPKNHYRIQELRSLGGAFGIALGSDSAGDVVGWTTNKVPYTTSPFGNQGTEQRAVIWQKNGHIKDLGTLGTGLAAVGEFINKNGLVAGQSNTDTTIHTYDGIPTVHTFRWRRGGRMQDLGSLGGTNSNANAINNRGQIAGVSNLGDESSYHGVIWGPGAKREELHTLGGDDSLPWWINNLGHAVGYANLSTPSPGSVADQVFHPVLWRSAKPIDLGHLERADCGVAFGANLRDQVVGDSGGCGGGDGPINPVGFLWQSGHMYDLNTLIAPPPSGLHIRVGYSINDRGDIAALGILPNGARRVVELVPQK